MTLTHQRFAQILTYAGTVPLLFVLGAQVMGATHCLPEPNAIILTYAAVIVSFLAGMHWATYIFYAERCPINLLLTSNIIALLAWVSLLSPLAATALALHMVCFVSMLIIDYRLYTANILPAWFYRLRANATIIVVLVLFIALLQMSI